MSEKLLVTKAWEHAEIHDNGSVLKRLALDFPHGCMAGIYIFFEVSNYEHAV